MTDRKPGTVITFYSYKGGTGRSMALANVAWILASNGYRVLVIDWDLEAPGLHRYFSPFLADRELTASDGVIDFVSRYADAVLTPPADESHGQGEWYRAYARISRLAASLTWDFDGDGTLDFIGAGRQGPLYASRVSNFPWQAFYERLGGGDFLDAARDDMTAEYDYVLLDSRTGVSDSAGICTMHLPDALVICFTLNNQSIVGAAEIAKTISQKPGRSEMPIFPLATRIELTERTKLEVRRGYARSRFALFPNRVSAAERDAYWGAMEIRYDPYYAYEEVLAPFGDTPGQEASLLASMERLTSYLSNGAVTRLQPVPERLRVLYRDCYASQAEEVVQEAERALSSFSDEEQVAVRGILTRLVRVARVDEGDMDTRARLPVRDFTGSDDVLRSLAVAGILNILTDSVLGEELVELADDALVQRWPTLCEWIDKDRAFLLWRQQFRSSFLEWERGSGALLSGRPLVDAREWLRERSSDLTDAEHAYIEVSNREEEEKRVREEEARLQLAETLATLSKQAALASTISTRRRYVVGVVGLVVAVLFAWRTAAVVSGKEEERLSNLVARGDSLLASADLQAARARYDSALVRDSLFVPAYLGRGSIHEAKGKYDSALADYGRAVALDESSSRALYQRARISRELGDYEPALRDLTRAAALDPRNPAVLYERGAVYNSLNQPDSALAYFNAAIALSSRAIEPYEARGRLYVRTGDRARARRDFQAALGNAGNDDDARSRLSAVIRTLDAVPVDSTSLHPVLPAPEVARITIQYQMEDDVAAASALYETLRRVEGWRVNLPERVLPGGANTPELYGGVRFFREGDRALAIAICEAVASDLETQGYAVDLPLWRMREDLFRTRPGLIEVWISPLQAKGSPQARIGRRCAAQ